MPLQNRVTPFGDIVSTSERGLLTGNRGILHDPKTRTLTKRNWTTRAWICCRLQFKGRRRQVMAQRSWTELFFLDEATALAAGHRPCFECRRAEAEAFRAAWAAGNGVAAPRAHEMDAVLHAERLDGRSKRLHRLDRPAADLPDGAMVAFDGSSVLVRGSRLWLWSPGGYAETAAPRGEPRLLTPPSIVRALDAGYRPVLHASALVLVSSAGPAAPPTRY